MGETSDETDDGESVRRLYQNVRKELTALFGHDAETSAALLDKWLAKPPHRNPDLISHLGPFEVGLRIQYEVVLGSDPGSTEYLEWRKPFNDVWQARSEPKLTERQKGILRSRGVDV